MRIVRQLSNTRRWVNRYLVEGDHGVEYTVAQPCEPAGYKENKVWHCSCPHWVTRLQFTGRFCKHISFLVEELDSLRQVSETKAREAYTTLVAYGQSKHTGRVSEGEALGYACFALEMASDPAATIEKSCKVVTEAAMEMLTQWNGHLSVAAIDAIENGKGKVTRDGRFLSIILPEHWGRL